MFKRLIAITAILLTISVAFAQPRDGTYRVDEPDFTFDITISGTQTGSVSGSINGIAGDIPFTQLQLQADGTLRGVFPIEEYMAGFVGHYHEGGETMDIYFYTLNDAGMPLAGSEEQYLGTRVMSFLDPEPQPEPEPEPEPEEPTGPSFGDLLGRQAQDDEADDVIDDVIDDTAEPEAAVPSIVAAWQGEATMGTNHLRTRLRLKSDNTFMEEGIIDGESVGLLTGTYTFEDGTLTMTTLEHPEQLCIGGQCQPFVVDNPTVYTVSDLTADSFTMTSPDNPNLRMNMTLDTDD